MKEKYNISDDINLEPLFSNIPKIKNPLKGNIAHFTIPDELKNLYKSLPKNSDIYSKLGISNNLSTILNSITEQHKNVMLNHDFMNSLTVPLIEQSNAFKDTIGRINTIFANLADTIMKKINITPFFQELSKSIDEIKKNPNSYLNWYNYYEKLSEYFWVYPYDMKPYELYNILETVSSEQEFDRYMSYYFSKRKIKELLFIIKSIIPRKHKKTISQIEKAYDMKLYILANNSLMAIIDDLLSFYLYNKGCTLRKGIFEPIVEDLKKKHVDISDNVFIVFMVNSYINKLYDSIDFNLIEIDTHKKSRRGMSAHGKFTSNERLDFIMLINTIYHLLNVQDVLRKYKKRIFKKGNKFFLPEGKDYKKLKESVDRTIEKKEKEIEKNGNS